MKSIEQLRIPYQKDPDLKKNLSSHLGIPEKKIQHIRVKKRSLDARNQKKLFWVYTLEVYFEGEKITEDFPEFPQKKWKGPPPLIIGAGPAGLFAALTFLKHGIRPILFERGARTHERMLKISRYWRHGELDEDSNVCNGEGGAGTFSDGKLITRIKSPLISFVMKSFVSYGAPPEITYVYNPHVGSNRIRDVIRAMSDDLILQGADLRFKTRVAELEIRQNQVQGLVLSNGEKIEGTGVLLACGHSAGKFFENLNSQGVHIEAKDFALGLRIEHPQSYINQWQYGPSTHCARSGQAPSTSSGQVPLLEELEPAQYKLQSYWEKEHTGVYSFCMCPGGYVISSTTDPKTIVVNGMSNFHRNSPWANAAIVCSVSKDRVPGNDPFRLMQFQRGIESKVYEASAVRGESRRIPAQHLKDFLENKEGKIHTKSSCPSGVVPANLADLLPSWICDYLSRGFSDFEKRRKGFFHPEALLHAVESRTSSPIRITRHLETRESVSTAGLFPCGEGPGYAGGITSAAVDGIEAALAWIHKFCS